MSKIIKDIENKIRYKGIFIPSLTSSCVGFPNVADLMFTSNK